MCSFEYGIDCIGKGAGEGRKMSNRRMTLLDILVCYAFWVLSLTTRTRKRYHETYQKMDLK